MSGSREGKSGSPITKTNINRNIKRLAQPVMFDWKEDLTGSDSRSFKCDID